MTSSPILAVHTPEGFTFDLPLAGPALRCLALLIDGAAIATIVSSANHLAGLAFGDSGYGVGVQLLIAFVVELLYAIILEWHWRGQTIGKRLFHIRVIDAQGLPLTLPQVAVRNLARVIDTLPAFYGVGGTAAALGRRRQRIGDLLAGTVVADERPQPCLPAMALSPGQFNSLLACSAPAYRLRQLASAAEAKLLLSALLRRDILQPAARLRLFRDLRRHFDARVHFPDEATAPLSDEQYLEDVAAILLPPVIRRNHIRPDG